MTDLKDLEAKLAAATKHQCDGNCSVDEPHPEEIDAKGVFCGACGRTRPSAKYVLKSYLLARLKRLERMEEALTTILNFSSQPHIEKIAREALKEKP